MRLTTKASLISILLVWTSHAQAEYCLNWSSALQKFSGQSRHCWNSEAECNSYYYLRCLSSTYKHDCAGMCYYSPGLYPPTGTAKAGKPNNSNDQATKTAEDSNKNKQEAQQRAAEQARQQMAFENEKQQLMGNLKGTSPSEPANRITLKPIPPVGGLARSQLDCVARNQPGESWEKRAADCAPVTPRVPEPPSPTAVEAPTDPALLAKFLEAIGQRISTSRESLAKQDHEIAIKERELAQEELKIAAPNKPTGESDALRRAREALEKAKADRARTSAELAKLEQQELAAKNKASPQAQ